MRRLTFHSAALAARRNVTERECFAPFARLLDATSCRADATITFKPIGLAAREIWLNQGFNLTLSSARRVRFERVALRPCCGANILIPRLPEKSELSLSQPVPKARPSIAWTRLPDGAVLFSPESEVYYAMNHVGALIWELLLRDALDRDTLCLAVQERFPDESLQQIRDDVAELLIELARNGLVADIERDSVA